MSKISIKVEQFDDEPAWSVLRRLARMAGTVSSRDFCLDYGLNFSDIEGGIELTEFARRGGYDLALLERSSIKWLPSHYEFAGQHIAKGGLINGFNRICASCLRDDTATAQSSPEFAPHWRDWWFVSGITTCPFHRLELISQPTEGNGRGGPNDMLDPWQETAENRQPTEIVDVSSDTYFLGRLGFIAASPHWLLDSLSVANGLKAVRKFGEFSLNVSQYTSMDADSNLAIHAIMSKGFAVLKSKTTMSGFLDGIYHSSGEILIRKGPRAVYGKLYEWLNVEKRPNKSGSSYEMIRDNIREHSVRVFKKQPIEELFYHRKPNSSKLELDIIAPPESLIPVSSWIETERRQLIGLAVDSSHQEIGREEIIRHYSIPQGTFLVLQAAGQILPLHRRETTRRRRRAWHRSDLDEWFVRLIGDAKVYDEIPAGMHSLVGASQVTQISIDKIVLAMLGQTLKTSGVLAGEKPWPSILVDIALVKSTLGGGGVEGVVSRRAAAARLKTTHVIIEALIQQGHLESHVFNGIAGIPKVCLMPASLDEFDKAFIPPRSAARHVDTAVKTLQRLLAERGVFPAFDLKTSANAVFYRRSEIEALPKGCLRLYD